MQEKQNKEQPKQEDQTTEDRYSIDKDTAHQVAGALVAVGIGVAVGLFIS